MADKTTSELRWEIRDLKGKLKKAQRTIDQYKAILDVADIRCENLHHDREEVHKLSEPCPVLARFEEILTNPK